MEQTDSCAWDVHPLIKRVRMLAGHPPVFDERDAVLLRKRIAARKATTKPLQGDLIKIIVPEGENPWRRVAHVWKHYDAANDYAEIGIEGIQPSSQPYGDVYLGSTGYGSYSGSLEPIIPWDKIEFAGWSAAKFWFFHHDRSGAGRGVDCWAPVRVWRVKT